MFEDSTTEQMIGTYHFRRLFIFRSAVIAIELVAMALAVFVFDVVLPGVELLILIAAYGAFNLIARLRLRKATLPASAMEFFLHLSVDVLMLSAMLYFSGGSGNPFVSLFLLPLVIVAATLPRRYVWAMAAVTMVCYALLMVVYVPLPDSGGAMHSHGDQQSFNFNLHVLGMWFSFVVGVGVILFFVVSMAEALRVRDKKLVEAREKSLRDEHVVALGTLAAGAAHELGTPLSTMAVLIGEMGRDYAGSPDLADKIAIFRSQLQRCKETLGQMSASAGQLRATEGRRENVKRYLERCVEQWKLLHPAAGISVEMAGCEPAPAIVADATLTQAVINILNNAVEASPERIALSASWTERELVLVIRDFGEGLSRAVIDGLGKPFFTTKREGHGLGFYLTQAVVSRLGGDVAVANHEEGGAIVQIRLPLYKLAAE